MDLEFGISLGISRVATGKRKVGPRVRYEDTPRQKWVIPEDLVLNRWRRKPRSRPGVRFRGVRLPPGTWRAVLACLETRFRLDALTEASLANALGRLRAERGDQPPLRTPETNSLLTMIRYLERRHALDPVLQRHRNDVNAASPGIPDLFLYRVETNETVTAAWFVEVKRPEERLLPSQIAELRFLGGLGLKTGVVRLVERP